MREGEMVVWVGAGWEGTCGSGFKNPASGSSVLLSFCPHSSFIFFSFTLLLHFSLFFPLLLLQ